MNNTKRIKEDRHKAVNKLIRTDLYAESIIRINHVEHLLYKEDIMSIINIYDFMSFLAHDKDVKQEIKWAMQFKRRYPFGSIVITELVVAVMQIFIFPIAQIGCVGIKNSGREEVVFM